METVPLIHNAEASTISVECCGNSVILTPYMLPTAAQFAEQFTTRLMPRGTCPSCRKSYRLTARVVAAVDIV